MLKWLVRRRIAAFERNNGYDSSYANDILDVSTRALFVFNRIVPMSRYRHDVPRDAWFAAKIATMLSEDCGPCTQLAITMAEREGVNAALLCAIVNGDTHAMTPDAALGFRFAQAALARSRSVDEYREAIERRWGRHAVVSLAFAIASSRVFPAVRYALGHGQTCQRVTVGGTVTPVRRHAA